MVREERGGPAWGAAGGGGRRETTGWAFVLHDVFCSSPPSVAEKHSFFLGRWCVFGTSFVFGALMIQRRDSSRAQGGALKKKKMRGPAVRSARREKKGVIISIGRSMADLSACLAEFLYESWRRGLFVVRLSLLCVAAVVGVWCSLCLFPVL